MVIGTIFMIPYMAASFINYKRDQRELSKKQIRQGLKRQKCRHCGHEHHHESAICCRACGTILMNMPSNEGDSDFGALTDNKAALIQQSEKQLQKMNKPQLIA